MPTGGAFSFGQGINPATNERYMSWDLSTFERLSSRVDTPISCQADLRAFVYAFGGPLPTQVKRMWTKIEKRDGVPEFRIYFEEYTREEWLTLIAELRLKEQNVT